MKQESKRPLYKTLYEKSTQDDNNNEAKKALDNYRDLAALNLHHLAEALEGALKTINLLASELNYQSVRWTTEHIAPIKEALNRIS